MSARPKQPNPKKQKTQEAKKEKEEKVEIPKAEDEEVVEVPEELSAFFTVQNKINDMDKKAAEEIAEIEKRYKKLKEPIFADRSKVLKTVPDFWKKCLLSHGVLSSIISEGDEKILDFLEDLKVEEWQDEPSLEGFRITMYFKPGNKAFSNRELTKEFNLQEDGSIQVKASKPQWKVEEPKDSFFSWFSDSEDEDADGIASILKDDIWPNPSDSFLGAFADDGEEGDEEEGDDE